MKSSLFERSGMLLADALLGIALISSATIFFMLSIRAGAESGLTRPNNGWNMFVSAMKSR